MRAGGLPGNPVGLSDPGAARALCETLNALEVRYPGTDLQLVYQAPGVA